RRALGASPVRLAELGRTAYAGLRQWRPLVDHAQQRDVQHGPLRALPRLPQGRDRDGHGDLRRSARPGARGRIPSGGRARGDGADAPAPQDLRVRDSQTSGGLRPAVFLLRTARSDYVLSRNEPATFSPNFFPDPYPETPQGGGRNYPERCAPGGAENG